MDLIIDPEFAEKIPPLTADEYKQLEENILADGILSPLIVWNGVIVDGHNRYRILQDHPEIPFQVHELSFSDRYEAIVWICRNQLGRRNLTETQRKYLVGKQYEAEKAMHGGSKTRFRDKETGQFTSSGKNDHLRASEKTSQRIAKEIGKGEKYVRLAEVFAKGIDAAEEDMPGIRQELFSGEIHPPDKDVVAIARASPEKRKGLVEQLRQPRAKAGPKKAIPKDLNAFDTTDLDDRDHEKGGFLPTLASARAISDGMASHPNRENKEVSVDIIIAELADAIDSMIFRWDFCLSANQPNASLEECQKQVRELAGKGISYLKSYQSYQGGE